jgi:hypothetical protein
VIGAYAAESTLLRSRRGGAEPRLAMSRLALLTALDHPQITAAHITGGDELRVLLSAARRLSRHEPADVVALHQVIAEGVLAAAGTRLESAADTMLSPPVRGAL